MVWFLLLRYKLSNVSLFKVLNINLSIMVDLNPSVPLCYLFSHYLFTFNLQQMYSDKLQSFHVYVQTILQPRAMWEPHMKFCVPLYVQVPCPTKSCYSPAAMNSSLYAQLSGIAVSCLASSTQCCDWEFVLSQREGNCSFPNEFPISGIIELNWLLSSAREELLCVFL